MKFVYLLSGALAAATVTFASPSVQAQAHDLYFAQAGAALTYSWAEARLLYGAISARKSYDPKITTDTLEELKRALASAKRQADRAAARLPKKFAKHRPYMKKLRQSIGKAERTLATVETDIEEQTQLLRSRDDPSELGKPLGGKKTPQRVDWKLLRRSVGWLAHDIRVARGLYKEAAMKVARRGLPSPPRPRGKRKS